MTERERWIVYPLLFLALGAALRDKLFDQTTSRSIICEDIICQELTVVDSEPRGNRRVGVMARIGRTESNTGLLEVNGVVNAQQYAYRDVPFMPGLPLGISWPDVFRALQQAAQRQQPANSPAQPSPLQPRPAQPPERSSPAAPLADPAEKR